MTHLAEVGNLYKVLCCFVAHSTYQHQRHLLGYRELWCAHKSRHAQNGRGIKRTLGGKGVTGVLLTEGAGQATEVKSAPTWPVGGTVSVPGGVFVMF